MDIILKEDITSIQELISWLENRPQRTNITININIQCIGNILNSELGEVNIDVKNNKMKTFKQEGTNMEKVCSTLGTREPCNSYEGKGYWMLREGDFFPERIEEMNAGRGVSDLCLKELDRRGMLFHSRKEADKMSEKVKALFKAEARDGFRKCP